MIPTPWELLCFSLNIVGWRLLRLYKTNGINQSLKNKLKIAIVYERKTYKHFLKYRGSFALLTEPAWGRKSSDIFRITLKVLMKSQLLLELNSRTVP